VVLDAEIDLARSILMGARVFEGVINTLSYDVRTLYDAVFVSLSIADEMRCTTWPLTRAMVPGRNMESWEDDRLVIA